ncbi:hypothetical protein AAMO2058_001756200, partial [Amorphochlora amoebiformis]
MRVHGLFAWIFVLVLAVRVTRGDRRLWRAVVNPQDIHGDETLANVRFKMARHYKMHIELAESEYLVDGGIIEVPLHEDGVFIAFKLKETTLYTMEKPLADQLPGVKTFHGKAIGEVMSGEFDITPHGFHAQIFCPMRGLIYIDPYSRFERDLYSVYSRREVMRSENRADQNVSCKGTLDQSEIPHLHHIHHHNHSKKHAKLMGIEQGINTPSASQTH